jgi:hypothetical protein
MRGEKSGFLIFFNANTVLTAKNVPGQSGMFFSEDRPVMIIVAIGGTDAADELEPVGRKLVSGQ